MSGEAYTYCVYVIQLGDDPKHVYVGQTYLTPEERLAQHKYGYKSSGYVKNAYSIKLRPDIYDQIPRLPSRAAAEACEENLAKNLSKLGYTVRGGH